MERVEGGWGGCREGGRREGVEGGGRVEGGEGGGRVGNSTAASVVDTED